MTFAESKWVPLVGDAPRGEGTRGVNARVRVELPDSLIFSYVLTTPMSGVLVPALQSPGRADRLWQHTCFEAFIAIAGSPGYYELNFSPSRQWAIYRFSGYREGMSPADVTVPPEISVRHCDDRLELDAVIRLSELTAPEAGRTLKLALSAVVADNSGTLSYWALKHAPGKPDFHHPDGFVLELTP